MHTSLSWRGFTRTLLLAVLCSLTSVSPLDATAQPLIGGGLLRLAPAPYTGDRTLDMPYVRIAYATPVLETPVAFGIEYSWHKSGKMGRYDLVLSETLGLTVGAKLTTYIGLEVAINGHWDTRTYTAEVEGGDVVFERVSQTTLLVTPSLLVYTHDVSHMSLGYGFGNTFRAGYALQILGY